MTPRPSLPRLQHERGRLRAVSSRTASVPAACTRPASCTRAAPTTGLFLQVVDDPGEELAIPEQPFGFAQLIRAQAAGDFASFTSAVAGSWLSTGGCLNAARHDRSRPHGRQHEKRLADRGHDVKTYDPQVESTASTLEELRDQLDAPRTFWMMVPAGKITEDTFQTLLGAGAPGDVIVDGGNSNFHDSQRRYADAKEKGLRFVDAGVSGGVWGSPTATA